MVWREVAAKILTNLYTLPNQTSVSAEYYHGIILEEYLLPVFSSTKSTGKFDERKLVDLMSA